jgi:hypothetical protein
MSPDFTFVHCNNCVKSACYLKKVSKARRHWGAAGRSRYDVLAELSAAGGCQESACASTQTLNGKGCNRPLQLHAAAISGRCNAESERSVQNGLAHLPVPTLITPRVKRTGKPERRHCVRSRFPASRRGSDKKAATALAARLFYFGCLHRLTGSRQSGDEDVKRVIAKTVPPERKALGIPRAPVQIRYFPLRPMARSGGHANSLSRKRWISLSTLG